MEFEEIMEEDDLRGAVSNSRGSPSMGGSAVSVESKIFRHLLDFQDLLMAGVTSIAVGVLNAFVWIQLTLPPSARSFGDGAWVPPFFIVILIIVDVAAVLNVRSELPIPPIVIENGSVTFPRSVRVDGSRTKIIDISSVRGSSAVESPPMLVLHLMDGTDVLVPASMATNLSDETGNTFMAWALDHWDGPLSLTGTVDFGAATVG